MCFIYLPDFWWFPYALTEIVLWRLMSIQVYMPVCMYIFQYVCLTTQSRPDLCVHCSNPRSYTHILVEHPVCRQTHNNREHLYLIECKHAPIHTPSHHVNTITWESTVSAIRLDYPGSRPGWHHPSICTRPVGSLSSYINDLTT